MNSISIVTTLYSSSKYLEEFYKRIKSILINKELIHEIIFVNDGSPDDSLEKIKKIAKTDPSIKVLNLSRNFGHHRAIIAGLESAKNDLVFLIDVDLEEKPENLEAFIDEFKKDPSLDCIYGIQQTKVGSLFKKILSLNFYRIFYLLTNLKINNKELVSRLMKKKFVDAIVLHQEVNLFLPGIWWSVGFKTKSMLLEKTFDNFSTYSLSKRINLAIDAITSYSSRPLHFVFYLGLFMFSTSALSILYFLSLKVFSDVSVSGWTSLITSLYLIGGIVLLSLGIIGVYISKIFEEVKRRPRVIISEIINGGNDA
jgi:putative glycosyltransferase